MCHDCSDRGVAVRLYVTTAESRVQSVRQCVCDEAGYLHGECLDGRRDRAVQYPHGGLYDTVQEIALSLFVITIIYRMGDLMKTIKHLLPGVLALMMLVGCSTMSAYEPPKEKQPHALVKLKYKYTDVKPDTTLGARMMIRHGARKDDDDYYRAFNKNYGVVKADSTKPKIAIEALKVHPGEKTDVKMAVYFYWYTTHSYTTYVNNMPMVQTQQVYNEAACTSDISFLPKAGKVYLLDYTNPNIDRDCRATAYEQIKLKDGKFKLKPVARSQKS